MVALFSDSQPSSSASSTSPSTTRSRRHFARNCRRSISATDAYVREFQAGEEPVICLRSASTWTSKHAPRLKPSDLTPKPQFMALYQRCIAAVVERYDRDGRNDMPGLKFPVRYYEIGSEFSSYEPEPVKAGPGQTTRSG
jgi:hypothetical protein